MLEGIKQVDKKKKRKRESKMSLICRSEMKQAFPERFFDWEAGFNRVFWVIAIYICINYIYNLYDI